MIFKCCNDQDMTMLQYFNKGYRWFKVFICNECGALLKEDRKSSFLIGISPDNKFIKEKIK